MPRTELCLAVVERSVPVVARRSMTGGLTYVSVVDVQAAHLLVMIGPFVHVRGTGHQAERQIDRTTAKSEEPTHPTEFNRIDPAALLHTLSARDRSL
jgi:hypothetical protein